MSNYRYEPVLVHHGIKGQKRGVRRFQKDDGSLTPAGVKRYGDMESNVSSLKAKYKAAKKSFNRDFNEAYRNTGIHITKKGRDANTQQWYKTYDSSNAMDKAKKEYKDAKKELKQAKKERLAGAKEAVRQNTSTAEKLIYGQGTMRKAAKLVAKNNMTVKEAMSSAKKQAWRNTALIVLASGVGSIAMSKLANSKMANAASKHQAANKILNDSLNYIKNLPRT